MSSFFVIGEIALVISTAFIVLNIIARIFGKAFPGNVEITTNINTVIAWMGFGLCALRGGHIVVDIIKKFPILDRICMSITFVGFCILAYCSFVQAKTAYHLKTLTAVLHLPKWPLYYVVVLGCIAMAIAILVTEINYYCKRYKLSRGEEVSFLEFGDIVDVSESNDTKCVD